MNKGMEGMYEGRGYVNQKTMRRKEERRPMDQTERSGRARNATFLEAARYTRCGARHDTRRRACAVGESREKQTLMPA